MVHAQQSHAIQLDGRKLEGGGQLVRIAVALSALTGQAVTIDHIRGNRSGKGGLKASHLAAITTLADLSGSKLVKAQVGSCSVGFYPPAPEERHARQTDSEIDIRLPTPGSVFLVFQALYPYLLHFASADRIQLSITGGTNVSSSPSYDYFSQVLIPNFARVGLPPLSVRLKKRGWSSSQGHSGLGKVVFEVDTLRSIETQSGGSPSHEARPTIPSIDLHKCRRGKVIKIDVTVLAPDDQLNTPHSTAKDSRTGISDDASDELGGEDAESKSIRTFMEQYTYEALRRRLAEVPEAVFLHRSSDEPDHQESHAVPIKTHTTEATNRRSCLYVLIVAHMSTGFKIGRDALYGSLTNEPKPKVRKGQKKVEEDMTRKVTRLVDSCVERFARELWDPNLEREEGAPRTVYRPCVDEYTRDQLVVFEALGGPSGLAENEEREDERYWSLHTKTAQWVCREMLGQNYTR
ncbi:RNA 3'-terminal phosphate cyclase domain-containing protein [Aspergillus unguis]